MAPAVPVVLPIKENDRLLEGGLWAEVTLGYNEVEDDDYAFYIQDLRPIQLSRFDFDRYIEGRTQNRVLKDERVGRERRSKSKEPATGCFAVEIS